MAYSPIQNYSFMFFPPPYDFLAPPQVSQPGSVAPEDALQMQGRGLGSACNGLGCPGCGGRCNEAGLGQTSTGLFGTGLFASSDPTQWGWGEWTVIGLGAWAGISAVTQVQAGGRAVRKQYRRLTS